MENITVGQVATVVALLAALIAGGVKIKDAVKKWLEALLKEKFDEQTKQNTALKNDMADLKTQLCRVDIENCKNYLVTYLAEVDRGEVKDEIEKQRFWEEYQHYCDKGGNSYVKEKVKKLQSRGVI